MPVFILSPHARIFPPADMARDDGLLAIGGSLEPEVIINGYLDGVFPWFNRGDPILWWSPDPRMVLFPDELHISKRFRRDLKKNRFQVTFNRAFQDVMTACANVRMMKGEETWITEDMVQAYLSLHQMGYCHSVEVWCQGELVGGLYGVALGRIFFGESMFSLVKNASKVALKGLVDHLIQRDFRLIDCQVTSGHLQRMGAREIPRKEFLGILQHYASAEKLF